MKTHTPGSFLPTRKAARRSLRCVDAERESRGFAIQFDSNWAIPRSSSRPSFRRRRPRTSRTPRALRTSTYHGDATHEKRPTRGARVSRRVLSGRVARRGSKRFYERKKRKASARLDKKKARRARGRASPRAPKATEYKTNRKNEKKRNEEPRDKPCTLSLRPFFFRGARRMTSRHAGTPRHEGASPGDGG